MLLETLPEPSGSDLGYKVYLNQLSPSKNLDNWIKQRREKAQQQPQIQLSSVPISIEPTPIPTNLSTTSIADSSNSALLPQSFVQASKNEPDQPVSQTSLVNFYWNASIIFRIFSILSLGLLPLFVYLWEACCANRQYTERD